MDDGRYVVIGTAVGDAPMTRPYARIRICKTRSVPPWRLEVADASVSLHYTLREARYAASLYEHVAAQARASTGGSLVDDAVQHVVSLFNVDEALHYLRSQCAVPDDAAHDVVEDCEEAIRRVLREVRWSLPVNGGTIG